MRVLVVEDEEILAEVVVELLRDHGHETDRVPDAPAALAAAESTDYDLVLLDQTLPSMSGTELLARWRARGLTARVLGMSGDQHHAAALGEAADGFLAKPFSFAELLARVAALDPEGRKEP